jgi:hypothetical protein
MGRVLHCALCAEEVGRAYMERTRDFASPVKEVDFVIMAVERNDVKNAGAMGFLSYLNS